MGWTKSSTKFFLQKNTFLFVNRTFVSCGVVSKTVFRTIVVPKKTLKHT